MDGVGVPVGEEPVVELEVGVGVLLAVRLGVPVGLTLPVLVGVTDLDGVWDGVML